MTNRKKSNNNEMIIIDEKSIKDKIYTIRGMQVMLDFDLACIYGYSTKAFNQQVQRNIDKFDEDFRFQLTREESLYIRSQIVTGSHRNERHNIYAFSEQGIYMLMTVLKGELAIRQSKALIRMFKLMKDHLINTNQLISTNYLYELTLDNTSRIKQIENTMITRNDLSDIMNLFNDNILEDEIFLFDGQVFKADLLLQRIFKKAKYSVYIIDDYISIKTLYHLRNVKVDIVIISDNKSNHLNKEELKDFIREYPDVSISFNKTNHKIHDRFIVLDYKRKTEIVYHLGSSIKDCGNKVSVINKFNNNKLIHPLLEELLIYKKDLI